MSAAASRCASPVLAGMRLAGILALPLACGLARAQAPTGQHWVGAWYSPPVAPAPAWSCNQVRTFSHQTVRQVVRLEADGDRVRIRLTNELGRAPLRLAEVRIALSSPNGVTQPGTDHVLKFGGRRGVVIPAGQALLSDVAALHVRRFQDLAISIFYDGRVTPSGHLMDLELSPPGDHASESVWPQATRMQGPAAVSGVEVAGGPPRQALVAFGDSITEGFCATPGTHRDYPEQLALLAAAHPAEKRWVIINSGISGNRLLREGAGPSALSRFDRDALDIPGVTAILLLEGINDIGNAYGPQPNSGPVSAADIIGAYRDLISRAHRKGLKIYLGTMTPYAGAGYSSARGEKVREQVNAWIRRGEGFDGVVDFDAALRDPASPLHFLGPDQCGDDLHPNDAGYRAMAETAFHRLFARGKD